MPKSLIESTDIALESGYRQVKVRGQMREACIRDGAANFWKQPHHRVGGLAVNEQSK